jgi:arginyl-tRNA synthetase
MHFEKHLEHVLIQAVEKHYGVVLPQVDLQPTKKEFAGQITVVVFSMMRLVKGAPEQIGQVLGNYLVETLDEVASFNVVKGFLNLELSHQYWISQLYQSTMTPHPQGSRGARLVEYSSPNTNKPLHLGHVRNNLLGYSVAKILEAAGYQVYKTQIINDRGIHICKSMLAWKLFGEGITPESAGVKGDKLVGRYYVAFDQAYKREVAQAMAEGATEESAKQQAPILIAAQEMLRQWEAGDPEVVELWKMMNRWVYSGFEQTYQQLGVSFDKYYYESDTYLLGKEVVEKGLSQGIFTRKPDGSVWIDLTADGLDEKILLRSDGTSVYMTQDLGTALQRAVDFPDVGGMVYTVGNEQDYHFKVLFLILKKLGYHWAEDLFHLSYGMVDLPSGKMKSREGTVVDADDLISDMSQTAQSLADELGKLEGMDQEQKARLYHSIGMGALKYYLLKVDPKKRILFDPNESVDFQGNTGPFIQYTYARIQSILRKVTEPIDQPVSGIELSEKEVSLLVWISGYSGVIDAAAAQYSPALLANYLYEGVKGFNSLYQNLPILAEANTSLRLFRIQLCAAVAQRIEHSLSLMGIDAPERM